MTPLHPAFGPSVRPAELILTGVRLSNDSVTLAAVFDKRSVVAYREFSPHGADQSSVTQALDGNGHAFTPRAENTAKGIVGDLYLFAKRSVVHEQQPGTKVLLYRVRSVADRALCDLGDKNPGEPEQA